MVSKCRGLIPLHSRRVCTSNDRCSFGARWSGQPNRIVLTQFCSQSARRVTFARGAPACSHALVTPRSAKENSQPTLATRAKARPVPSVSLPIFLIGPPCLSDAIGMQPVTRVSPCMTARGATGFRPAVSQSATCRSPPILSRYVT